MTTNKTSNGSKKPNNKDGAYRKKDGSHIVKQDTVGFDTTGEMPPGKKVTESDNKDKKRPI